MNSPRPNENSDQKVEDFINLATMEWIIDMLHNSLQDQEAKTILGIPLAKTPVQDKFI